MLNKPYLSIQEMLEKTIKNTSNIHEQLDASATYHPEEGSLLTGLKAADKYEVQQALQNIPLREFLVKSGTTGVAGAAYLVAAAVHTKLEMYVAKSDICPLISRSIVSGWEGGDLTVDIPSHTGYTAKKFASGGSLPTETIETKAATLTPISFGLAPRITDDLIDDAAFDLVDWHLQLAAQGIGELASDLALTVLGTATDGWGTLNSGNASADETTWAQLETAVAANTDDRWLSNTVVCTREVWEHSLRVALGAETAGGAAGDYWQPYAEASMMSHSPVAAGFDFKIGTLDFMLATNDYLHAAYPTDTTAMTNCITFVFDRNNALLTGRKRWMKLSNYADPVKDLSGMTITCRQDSVTLFNDSIYKLSET